MTPLIFLFAVTVIFGAVLAMEVSEGEADALRPRGLISWLTGGNWPAKIGGGLLVVGIGALLRYGLVNFDVEPVYKLALGLVLSGVLGLSATLTRIGSSHRAVSLALGGAAFGVAYLTAYSAFALFHYLDSPVGVGLLALTAAGAAVYAVSRGALSLAILAMLGAFIAPAFALSDPGPAVIYGYYVAASLMTLLMVVARGWRPLIHLSFLFTILGGGFFAWTSRYYQPEYAKVMLPSLLVLAAIHVVMPLLERAGSDARWMRRLDIGYLIALPAVCGLSAVVLAPGRAALSAELLALGGIWLLVSTFLLLARRPGLGVHLVVGALLVGFGLAARFQDLPWELIGLAFSVGALGVAAYRSKSESLHNVLAGLVPIVGFLHVFSSLSDVPGTHLFANGRFVERMVGAALFMTAGYICQRIRQSLDTLLWTVGIGWAVIAIGSELIRWDLLSLGLFVHFAALAAAVALVVWTPSFLHPGKAILWTAVLLAISSSWALPGSGTWISFALVIIAPAVLLALSLRSAGPDPDTRSGRFVSVLLAPFLGAMWSSRAASLTGALQPQFSLFVVASVGLTALLCARVARRRSEDWITTITEIFSFAFAFMLISSSVAMIARDGWAVLLEILCACGLLLISSGPSTSYAGVAWVRPGAALGAALLLQANLLRIWGPPGDLDITDLAHLRYPALISLLWAVIGGMLTVWARHTRSRSQWATGAVLLCAAAVKLVLLDFGSLGQLGNILAVIAAGVVFMLVGFLAPMPPKEAGSGSDAARDAKADPRTGATATPATPAPQAQAAPKTGAPASEPTEKAGDFFEWNARRPMDGSSGNAQRSTNDGERKNGWSIALVVVGLLILTRCGIRTLDGFSHRASLPSRGIVDVPAPAPRRPDADSTVGGGARPGQSLASPSGIVATAVPRDRRPIVETECSQWASRLPDEYDLYVAGAYQGRPLDFTIDDSDHRAGRFDVLVHAPGKNIVLALGAYEPSIWNIKWSRDTHIAGVWLSGYYTARINGLDANTPLLVSPYVQRGACPYFHVSNAAMDGVTQAIATVLPHEVNRAILANDGRVYIGRTELTPYYVQGDVRQIEDFRMPGSPLAGQRGIEELLREGKLRRATLRDLNAYRAHLNRVNSGSRLEPSSGDEGAILPHTYVVLDSMVLPPDIRSSDATTFIISEGVELPRGKTYQVSFLDMNQP
ncbi:MAG: DUF2339 domain-containing protein [Steroidobacteraceae bacterium]